MATATSRARTIPQIATMAADGRAQLLKHVQSDLTELRAEVKTLEATERALKGHATAAPTTTRRATGNGAKTTSRKPMRKPKMITEAMIMDALNAGQDTSPKVAKHLRVSQDAALRKMRALAQTGKIGREGTGANVRWFAVGIH